MLSTVFIYTTSQNKKSLKEYNNILTQINNDQRLMLENIKILFVQDSVGADNTNKVKSIDKIE